MHRAREKRIAVTLALLALIGVAWWLLDTPTTAPIEQAVNNAVVDVGEGPTLMGQAPAHSRRVPAALPHVSPPTPNPGAPSDLTLQILLGGQADHDHPGLPVERQPLAVEVVDLRGRPIPGAVLRARWGEWHTAVQRADAKGHATLQVPPGTTLLEVVGWDHSDDRELFLVHFHSLEPGRRETRVVVRSGKQVAGRLVTRAGAPIAAATVRIVSPAFGFWGAQTDAEGKFSMSYLEETPFDLVFEGETAVAGGAAEAYVEHRALLRNVRAGDTNLELVAAPVTLDGSVEVQALGPDGHPLPGAVIHAIVRGTHGRLQVGRADEHGLVVLDGLPRWPVEIKGAHGSDGEFRLKGSTGSPVLPEGQRVVLRLASIASVAGRVLDAEGRPVAKAWCAVLQGGHHVACFGTDDAGRFSSTSNLPAGSRVQVTARHPMENCTSLAVLDDVVLGSGELTLQLRPIDAPAPAR